MTPGAMSSFTSGHQQNASGSLSGHGASGAVLPPGGMGGPGNAAPGQVNGGYGGQSMQQQKSQQPSPSQMRQPGSTGGLPGAASGFKFGGPPPPSGMNQFGSPGGSGGSQPGSVRNRTVSQDEAQNISMSSNGMSGEGGHSGMPPNGMVGPAGAMQPGASGPAPGGIPRASGERARPQVVYPWSQRLMTMNPPRYLDESRTGPAGAVSPSPFPRYGHAANTAASPNGEVYLFGGLVRESVKNDLYCVQVDRIGLPPVAPGAPQPTGPTSNNGVSATLVQTTGEIPPPRVGHATILVSNVVILWGGDTKIRADDKQDEGLYLLNLSTREWTRVKSEDAEAGPTGRYGHTVSIVGARFFVFGGQVDGSFMNDLWSFDLNSLKSVPKWELIKPSTGDAPPRRTGHASVTYNNKIYIFGGTDGQFHYNDTWCYDVAANSWKELSCIGYIPVPREGHATCLVDDVMYIFGGRGVDGRDLGDLASFKISNQRWYMFANMGPAPSGRSGHVLTTYQNRVLVLGGESFTGGKPDDPSTVHVLDTAKIKYPPDNRAGRKTSLQGQQSPAAAAGAAPTQSAPAPTAAPAASFSAPAPAPVSNAPSAAPVSNAPSVAPVAAGAGAAGVAATAATAASAPGSGLANNPKRAMSPLQTQQQRTVSPSYQQQSAAPPYQQQTVAPNSSAAAQPNGIAAVMQSPDRGGPPSRLQQQQQQPPQQMTRIVSPTRAAPQAPQAAPALQQQTQSPLATSSNQSPPQQNQFGQRIVSPSSATANGAGPLPYAGPRSQRSIENLRGQGNGAVSPTSPSQPRTINGVMDRSASPTTATQDGFHYRGAGMGPVGGQGGMNAATKNELEALRKREAWMKAALLVAHKKGFVTPEELEMPDGTSASAARDPALNFDSIDTGAQGSDKERVLKALVSLKSQLAAAKSKIAQQADAEVDRSAESDRGRIAALQEAAFYRAKLHALEKGDVAEASRMDRERSAQSEKQLSEALREASELERQIQSLREELKLEQNLRASAEERLSDTAKRAMAAEGAQMRAYDELAMLQKRSHGHETQLRDHQEQVAQLSTLAARHRSDHESARAQLDESESSLQHHVAALTQLQAALNATESRAGEHEKMYIQHRDVANQHQETINQLKSALDAKNAETEGHVSRIADLEALVNTHRSEADTHRSALGGNLAQLLTLHQQRAARGSPTDIPDHINEKLGALEAEADTLRQLHTESRSVADSATNAMQDLRDRNVALERQHTGLKTELSAMRSQLAIALQEVSRLKDQSSSKELESRDRARALEAAQLRDNLLRRYISDRGIDVPGDEELSAKGGFADKRIRELEGEMDAKDKQLREAEEELQKASVRAEHLTRELESRGGETATRSRSQDSEFESRAELAERELAEATASYKERIGQMEADYQTAVGFVKGSERMLRRMKDELSKYKAENASLQQELTSSSTRSAGLSGDLSEAAARDIEALRKRVTDLTAQAEESAAENRELEKRLAATIADQKDFHDRSRQREDAQIDHSRRAVELEAEVSRLRKEVHDMLTLNQHLSTELKAADAAHGPANGPNSSANDSNGRTREIGTLTAHNDHLRAENEGLARRLQETEDKLGLLLGRMESSVDGDHSTPMLSGGLSGSQTHGSSTGVPGIGLGLRGGSADGHGRSPKMTQYGQMQSQDLGRTGSASQEQHQQQQQQQQQGRFSISSELDRWEKDRGLGAGVDLA